MGLLILSMKNGDRLHMKKTKKNIYKKILILVIAIYVIVVLGNQQKTLNKYSLSATNLETQIEEQEQYKTELAKKQENVGSLEFIEQTAREKLEMYLPNERVYLDKGN